MKRYAVFLIIALLLAAAPAQAQEPDPTPEPPSNPLLESGPGIPQPFDIPPIDPENTINMDPFWDYETLSNVVSIILTLFLLLKQNLIMQAVVLVALFGLALVWMVRIVRSRPQNI